MGESRGVEFEHVDPEGNRTPLIMFGRPDPDGLIGLTREQYDQAIEAATGPTVAFWADDPDRARRQLGEIAEQGVTLIVPEPPKIGDRCIIRGCRDDLHAYNGMTGEIVSIHPPRMAGTAQVWHVNVDPEGEADPERCWTDQIETIIQPGGKVNVYELDRGAVVVQPDDSVSITWQAKLT